MSSGWGGLGELTLVGCDCSEDQPSMAGPRADP